MTGLHNKTVPEKNVPNIAVHAGGLDRKMLMDGEAEVKIINQQIITELDKLGIYKHLSEKGVTEIVINDPGRHFY